MITFMVILKVKQNFLKKEKENNIFCQGLKFLMLKRGKKAVLRLFDP